MNRKFNQRIRTAINPIRIQNNNLPSIPNKKMGKTGFQFYSYKTMKNRAFLSSADFTRKYRLDYQKYRDSINSKKEKIFSLEKECKNLKDKTRFNNEIVKEILILNNTNIDTNINNNYKSFNQGKINIKNIEKVRNYKIINNTLENIKNKYIKGKLENKKIKTDIWSINDYIKETENNIQQKKNEIINFKNKIKIAEKNKKQKNELLNEKEKENNKVKEEIVKYFKKQIDLNKNKLNEKESLIKEKDELIEKLKLELKELEEKVNK